MSTYLTDSLYDVARRFNHEPNSFNYEEYIANQIIDFKKTLDHVEKTKEAPKNIGKPKPQIWRP